VRDTQCGFKAFTAEAARDLFRVARIDGWAFDLEVLALAKRRGFDIAEVGVEWKDDNRSRVSPLKDMVNVCREALTIRRNLKAGVYNQALPAAA
jgi:dolichyl-phosphate beta-glucosyltransferase